MTRRSARAVVAFVVAVVAGSTIVAVPAAAADTTVSIITAPSSPIVANSLASFQAHIAPFASGRTISWYVNGGLAGQSLTNPNGNASIGLTFGAGGYDVIAVLEPVGGVDRAQSDDVLLVATQDPSREPDWFFVEELAHPTVGAKGAAAQIAVDWSALSDTQMSITATDTDSATTVRLAIDLGGDSGTLGPGVFTSDSSHLTIATTGCGAGSVTKLDFLSFGRNASYVPYTFALTFEFKCNDATWPIVGAIRYNSSTLIPALSLPTGSPAFDSVIAGDTGDPQAFALTNTGDAGAAMGQLVVGGADADDFSITSDACSGTNLDAGDTCAFDVTFAPTTAGPKSAELVIASDLGTSPRDLFIGGQGLIPESVSPPDVIPEQQYFNPGIRYRSTITPNPQVNGSECLVDGEHLDGSIPDENGFLGCVAPRPDPGEHTVRIRYLGSPFHGGATSPETTFVVDPTTLTSITLSDDDVPSNAAVTVTATVSFGGDVSYPGGTLTITDDSTDTVIASGTVGPDHPSVVVTRSFTDGAHHLVAEYAGLTSAEDPSSGSADLMAGPPDLTAPAASAPVHALSAAPLASGAVPVRLTWTGSDAGSGIDHYIVALRSDGGAWSYSNAALTSAVRSLRPGHTYVVAVRAVDRAGNTSPWRYGAAFRLSAVSETSTAVHYRGSWSTSRSTVWWGGTARSSSVAGSSVSYTFTGKSIAWVSVKASTRGKAAVYVNGVFKATVDLYSATTLKQRVVWTANYSTSVTRTVTIKVLGTSGRPRVDIDGFVVAT